MIGRDRGGGREQAVLGCTVHRVAAVAGSVVLAGCSSTQGHLQSAIQKALEQSPQSVSASLDMNPPEVRGALNAPVQDVFAVVATGQTGKRVTALDALVKAGWLKARPVMAWSERRFLLSTDYVLTPKSAPGAERTLAHAADALKAAGPIRITRPVGVVSYELYRHGVVLRHGGFRLSGKVRSFFAGWLRQEHPNEWVAGAVKALVAHGDLAKVRPVWVYQGQDGHFVESLANAEHAPSVSPGWLEGAVITHKGRTWLSRSAQGIPLAYLATGHFVRVLHAQPTGQGGQWAVQFMMKMAPTPVGALPAVVASARYSRMGSSVPPVAGDVSEVATFTSAALRTRIGPLRQGSFVGGVPKALTLYTETPAGRAHLKGGTVAVGRWEPQTLTNYSKPEAAYDGEVLVEETFRFDAQVPAAVDTALKTLAYAGASVPAGGAVQKEKCLLMPMHHGYQFDTCGE